MTQSWIFTHLDKNVPYFKIIGDYLYVLQANMTFYNIPARILLHKYSLVGEWEGHGPAKISDYWDFTGLEEDYETSGLHDLDVGRETFVAREDTTDDEVRRCREDLDKCLNLMIL